MNCKLTKAVASLFFSVLFAVSLVGCGNRKLTDDQAQTAVWTSLNGAAEDVKVIGVREIPDKIWRKSLSTSKIGAFTATIRASPELQY